MFPSLLVAAIAAAYANAIPASFQFDDWTVAVNDPRVQSLPAWWASMPGIRPLLKLSYACNHALGGSAAVFHAVNVAIHTVNALLVYALFVTLARREGAPAGKARVIAAAGASVFALLPVQTEAVTYVTGRSSSMAALFCLASLLAWTARRRLFSAVLFAAAILTKETAVVVPAAIVLWEATGPIRPPVRALARSLVGHLAVLGVAALAMAASPDYRYLAATSFSTRSIAANLAAQSQAVVYLAGQLVRFDRLNADPALHVVPSLVLPSAVAVSGLIAAGLFSLRRAPAIAFGVLWFFVWLAPTNSVVPRLDAVNDRQVYLAAAGAAWILAWTAGRLSGARALAAGALAVSIGLGTAVHVRNEAYRLEIVFWEDVARKSPHNPRAFNNAGYAYALAGRAAEAEAAFEMALALDPAYGRAAENLQLLRDGQLTSAKRRRW